MTIDTGRFSTQLIRLFRLVIAVGALTAPLAVAGCASGDWSANNRSGFTFDDTRNSAAEVEQDARNREAEAEARRDAYAREHGKQ